MSKYLKRILNNIILSAIIIVAAFANWQWPFFVWLGDTIIYRFIWLGIFFILLDLLIENIASSTKAVKLISESMGVARDLRKLSESFRLLPKIVLPNGSKADFVAVGSSGVWLITAKDGDSAISFDGDDLVQDGKALKRFLSLCLEKSFYLSEHIKKKLNKDFKVTPVVTFSSPKANLESVPKIIRGVYISPRQNVVSLIENTDIQLINETDAEEIYNLLKNKTKL